MISASPAVAATRPCSAAKWHQALRPFPEYLKSESQNGNSSAVSPDGELWEQETLQLRVTPPMVEIDNNAAEDATRVTISSANRPGTLVEVVTCLVELGLLVKRGRISSDQGWFADDFFVTEANGEKVTNHEKIVQIQKILCVDSSSQWSESGGGQFVELEMSGEDRPGLLADITQLLSGYGYDVKTAAVWTQGKSVAVVMIVANMAYNNSVDFPKAVREALMKELSGTPDCAVDIVPSICRRHVHHEHRLHFMLLKEAQKYERSKNGHDCSFQHRLISPKAAGDDVVCTYRSPKLGKPNVSIQSDRRRGYWMVHVKCKDRQKLLFDTVCTLADLDFDVYHGSVDCRNDVAVLELFVRPRYQHLECIHDTMDNVQRSLEDALTRRFPKGLKLHVRPSNKPECLTKLLQALRHANLCVTRAKVRRCDDCGNAVHTVYVMNTNGTPPCQRIVEDACRSVGGKLIFCECQGREADPQNDPGSFHQTTRAFFLKERILDVEWSGPPRSI